MPGLWAPDPGKRCWICALARAAKRGERAAEFLLGRMFYLGEGVERNLETAFSYYRKSAEKGDADAMYELGMMLYDGLGTRKDRESAAVWLKRASAAGNRSAR